MPARPVARQWVQEHPVTALMQRVPNQLVHRIRIERVKVPGASAGSAITFVAVGLWPAGKTFFDGVYDRLRNVCGLSPRAG